MGCDIHSIAEKKVDGKWVRIETDGRTTSWGSFFIKKEKYLSPFNWRNYSVFAFLADVRNYDHCEPLSEPKGLPEDSEYLNSISPYAYDTNPMNGKPIPENERETIKSGVLDTDYHSHSWFTLKELIDFDYDKTFWNRRVTKQTSPNSWNGAALAEEGEGVIISYKENLGKSFFEDIELLKTFGNPENVRIIFWFDN